jgi:hypothetical protein
MKSLNLASYTYSPIPFGYGDRDRGWIRRTMVVCHIGFTGILYCMMAIKFKWPVL